MRGIAAINSVANSSKNNNFNTFTSLGLDSLIIGGRVISIVLDETHPRFKELGEWNALGVIEFDSVNSPTPPNQFYPTARPLDPAGKTFPLINEIVYMLALPNTNIGEFTSTKTNYYINTVGIWNHPHHNAFPQNSNILPPSQQKDYVQTELGSVRRVTDQSTEIFLGETFVERGNIHPLLPFEGDRIFEGRWGNSIRLGSTVKNTPNTWSSTGTNGDPITILRNGQGNQTDEGWIPTIEDINNDDASIYLTSTQKIPLKAASTSYNSYSNNPPTNPTQYSGKQVILNSGRLVLNTTEDHLLLSSKQSVNINAITNFNVDAPQSVIQSSKVLLGGINATEPVLKGNTTINLLNELVDQLTRLSQALQTSTDPAVNLAAQALTPWLINYGTRLGTAKSNVTTTL
jgi:hypothetical protein